ncbi:CBS domain-containing protein [Cytobacillus firmus]|uniref:CBS domain-containing protein n=1 Tax=Cytobacillus firmus TaxID=1399 RepID=UPI0021AE0E68|nr:CBS domain-containing protein [Cytobacillus firmus]
MTENPVTISRFAYYYDALSLILLKGVKHLPVMEDSKVAGIVTLSDLLRRKNENVMKTVQKIEKADRDSLPQIKTGIYDIIDSLIRDRVPIFKMLKIITKLYDRLAGRIIALSISELKRFAAAMRICFLSNGLKRTWRTVNAHRSGPFPGL